MKLLLLILGVTLLTIIVHPLSSRAQSVDDQTQDQTQTPIKHVIYLMQENHSFDNYFGTYPGADGIPEGTCMPTVPSDKSSACIAPFAIGGMGITDLGHSRAVFLEQLNHGRMDGFVAAHNKRNGEGRMAMGYYTGDDIPYYWNLADEYVLFDRFFTSALGGSVWNHNFWVSATPGSDEDSIPENGYGEEFITIFDRLEERGISWKFYIQNYDARLTYRTMGQGGSKAAQIVWAPVLNIPRFLDNPDLFSKIVPLDEYFEDLRTGTLPAVSYIVPSGASEHPPGSIRAGQSFVKVLIQELMKSSKWNESAFIWSYDDWGGWYDHVNPPRVDAYGYGFRAPAMLVSPYAKRGFIDSTEYDFTSPIKFITENWNLAPLAQRDRNANSIIYAFDFTQPPRLPILIPAKRPAYVAKREPRRLPVYLAYSGALFFASLVIAIAHIVDARAQRVAPPSDKDQGILF